MAKYLNSIWFGYSPSLKIISHFDKIILCRIVKFDESMADGNPGPEEECFAEMEKVQGS